MLSSISQDLSSISPDAPNARQHADLFLRLSKLPPFRPAVLKLLSISGETVSAIFDFEDVFRSDPALTADLLIVANSVEFGLRSRIETIRHALTFLGVERVRSLASAIAMSYVMGNLAQNEYVRSVWSHSVATAVIAETLGNLSGLPGLYTAGLTHDMGRLGLFLVLGAPYAQALSAEFADMREAFDLEKSMFSMTHCEAGAALQRAWSFPERLCACAAGHHDSVKSSHPNPLHVVQIACRLADSVGFPELQRADLESEAPLPEGVRNHRELAPERLRERIARHVETVGSRDAAADSPQAGPTLYN